MHCDEQQIAHRSTAVGLVASDYATPPSTNYEDISRNIDANLAEIDMETFRSEDINAIFTMPNMFDRIDIRQKGCEQYNSMPASFDVHASLRYFCINAFSFTV